MKNLLFIFLLSLASLTIFAQYSREQAVNYVIEEIIGADSLNDHYLYSRYEKMNIGDTLWCDALYEYFLSPFDTAWVFFSDDMPIAFWVHPCRFIFFDLANGNTHVINHNWPPLPFLSDWPAFIQNWQWVLNPVSNGKENRYENKTSISLYPNPAKDVISFQLPHSFRENIELKIYNLKGKPIKKNDLIISKSNELSLNISGLSHGSYILIIKQNGRIICSEKFIKII